MSIESSTIHLFAECDISGRNATSVLFLRVLEPEAGDVKLQDDTMVYHPIDGGSRCHGVLDFSSTVTAWSLPANPREYWITFSDDQKCSATEFILLA